MPNATSLFLSHPLMCVLPLSLSYLLSLSPSFCSLSPYLFLSFPSLSSLSPLIFFSLSPLSLLSLSLPLSLSQHTDALLLRWWDSSGGVGSVFHPNDSFTQSRLGWGLNATRAGKWWRVTSAPLHPPAPLPELQDKCHWARVCVNACLFVCVSERENYRQRGNKRLWQHREYC